MNAISKWHMASILAVMMPLCCALYSSGAEAEIAISYDLPEDGRVSVVICNAEGVLVREFLHAAPRKQGRNTETWDGLDEQGNPVAPGAYTWKLLLTQGLRAEYLLTLGTNPTPPWDTWPGNHHGVSSVAADADGMYVATSSGEGTILGLKQTLEGKRLWSIPRWVEAWRGGHAMASANGKLYMLHTNGAIHVFNSATGKHEAKWDLARNEAERKDSAKIMDMDAHGDHIVISYTPHNAIRWISPENGSVLDEASVPGPTGIALAPSGRVFFISNDAVLSLTRENKTPQTVLEGLPFPWRLDIEDQTGDIFVTERGEAQHVRRFSKDGKLLNEYGIRGGRPGVGRFESKGFSNITDIAADQKGGFVACEATTPRRTLRVNKEGKFVRQWFGGQRYSNFASPDPVDPTTVWMDSQWGTFAKVKADYEKKTWSMHSTYYGKVGDVRRRDGRTYLCISGQLGGPAVFTVDEGDVRPIQVADLSGLGFGKMCSMGKGLSYLGYKNNKTYRIAVKEWTDDGKPVHDEPEMLGAVPRVEGDLGSRETGPLAEDANGNIYGVFNGGVSHPPFGVGWWASTTSANRVVKWDKTGKFLWAVGRHAAEPKAGPGEGKFLWGPVGAVKGCILARDVEAPVHVWDKDGLWVGTLFDNPDTEAAPLEAYSGPSECFYGSLYVVPDDSKTPGLKPGQVLFYGSGQNNNPIFRISGWEDFRRQTGAVTVTPAQAETVVATKKADLEGVVSIPHIGRGYMNGIQVDGRISKGEWKNGRVLQIKYDDEAKAKVHIAWQAVYASMNARHGLCVAFEVNTYTPWESSSEPEFAFEGGASVEVRLGPVEPERKTPGPGDIRVVAAAVGEKIKTEDADEEQRKTMAMEFIPKLPSGWGKNRPQPQTYKSGTGEITFDRVQPLSEKWVAAKAKEDGSGYIVEMLIPVRPSLYVRPGLRFRLDLSIVLANEDGTESLLRLPWHSEDAGDRAVEDTYNQSLLRPHTWAEVMLVD